MEGRSYAKRLFKGSTTVFIALIASGLVGFLLRMLLARSLSVDEYGLLFAVLAFVSFLTLFRGFGVGGAVTKYVAEFTAKGRLDRVKSSMIAAFLLQGIPTLLISAMLFLFSDQIALGFFGSPAAALVIKILSVWFFASGLLFLLKQIFQGLQDMSAYALTEFLSISFVLASAVVLLGIFGLGVGGAALAYLLGAGLATLFGSLYLAKTHGVVLKGKIAHVGPLAKKLLTFGLIMFLGGVGAKIIGYVDTLTITAFRTLPEVGLYQAAQPASHILWYFPTALCAVLFPMVSELWAKREKRLLGNVLHFLIKFSFILMIPIGLVFITFPGAVLLLLFGPDYLAASAALQLLGMGAIIYSLYLILTYAVVAIGKPAVTTKILIVMACFNLMANLILVPPYGIEGAAFATFSTYVAGFMLISHFSTKLIKFSIPWGSILKTLIGGALLVPLIFSLKAVLELWIWLEFIVVFAISSTSYMFWLFATKTITYQDLELLKSTVPMPKWVIKILQKFVKK